MRNLAALRKKAMEAKKLVKNNYSGDYPYIWVRMNNLQYNTRYIFRILPPHPEKCPDGGRLYVSHNVAIDVLGNDSKKILCPKYSSYNENEDCFICDILEIYDNNNLERKVKKSVNDCIDAIRPQITYLIPTIWYADVEEQEAISRKGNKYTKTILVPNNNNPTLAVFQVTWDSVMEQLEEIMTNYPNCSSQGEDGRYISITRTKTTASLIPSSKTGKLKGAELIDKYPNIKGFGEDKLYDYDKQEALLESCWWWKHIAPFITFDDSSESEEEGKEEDKQKEPLFDIPF